MESKKRIFREKTLRRISSPEQMNDYLHVTSPGIWAVLGIVIFFICGIVAWSTITELEITTRVKVDVEDRRATVIPQKGDQIEAGMTLKVAYHDYILSSVDSDEYGRTMAYAKVNLPTGVYDGFVVVERMKPIEFLWKSR